MIGKHLWEGMDRMMMTFMELTSMKILLLPLRQYGLPFKNDATRFLDVESKFTVSQVILDELAFFTIMSVVLAADSPRQILHSDLGV